VQRLAEGGKRREKSVFTDGDSRFQVLAEDGERLLYTCVDNFLPYTIFLLNDDMKLNRNR
jgi:hypothetical protein